MVLSSAHSVENILLSEQANELRQDITLNRGCAWSSQNQELEEAQECAYSPVQAV